MGEGAEKGRGEGAALVDAGGGRKSTYRKDGNQSELETKRERRPAREEGRGLTLEHCSDDPSDLLDGIVLSIADLWAEEHEALARSTNWVLEGDSRWLIVSLVVLAVED